MLKKLPSLILVLLCLAACKKDPTVCNDENAVNFGMEDSNGGASCEFAINIDENLYDKWKVNYHVVYNLPSNQKLNSLIAEYATFTFVEFEEFYNTDYPINEIEWAKFITGQLGLSFYEYTTPNTETNFTEIEFSIDKKVKYYENGLIDDDLTNKWIQFDYDHLAYYTGNYIPGDETDLVEIRLLDETNFNYNRVIRQGNTKIVEFRSMTNNY